MPQGGCLCNKIRVDYTGEPDAHLLCHCRDCKKISGAPFSDNIVIKDTVFKIEGTPRTFTKTADTGKKITSHFCGDCGTTLIRTGDSFPGAVILKAGILDDPNITGTHIPGGELFAPERCAWVSAIDGANQVNTMPQ